MSLVRWKPNQFPTTFNRVFDDFFNAEFPEWSRKNYAAEGGTLPAVNVRETDDDFQLEIAAPGLQKKDFSLEVVNNVLTITGKKEMSEEEKDEDDGFLRREFRYTSFQRSFSLPDSVDSEKVSAKYADGILKVNIPKKAEAKPKPPKTIKVG